jgi:hypothetical protein
MPADPWAVDANALAVRLDDTDANFYDSLG